MKLYWVSIVTVLISSISELFDLGTNGLLFSSRRICKIASTGLIFYELVVDYFPPIVPNLSYCVMLLYLIILLFPYLSKASRLSGICKTIKKRPLTDKLVWTSIMYSLAAVCAVSVDEVEIGMLCTVTFVGSTLYHYYREMQFFNLDNIFATSLFVVFSSTVISSYSVCFEFFLSCIMGFPVAAFLLVYCGMPADIAIDTTGTTCTRTGRGIYDSVHTLWHIVSGVGPLLSVWYIWSLKSGQFEWFGAKTVIDQQLVADIKEDSLTVPIVAVAIGVMINVAGNVAGIMPID